MENETVPIVATATVPNLPGMGWELAAGDRIHVRPIKFGTPREFHIVKIEGNKMFLGHPPRLKGGTLVIDHLDDLVFGCPVGQPGPPENKNNPVSD